jgi:serine/threonine protein kinase
MPDNIAHAHNFIDVNGEPLQGPILGMGGAGVVVARDGIAVKVPKLQPDDDLKKVLRNLTFIDHEKEVYRRLNGSHYIVRCLSVDMPSSIPMELMEKGNMYHFLRRTYHQRDYPPRSIQLWWFRGLARGLREAHERRILLVSIFTRNILLGATLKPKFSDFGRSVILPLDADLATARRWGYTAHMDIGQFGMLMYQVIAGGQYRDFGFTFSDLHPGAESPVWPARESLPVLGPQFWLREVIETCWTEGGYPNANALVQALDGADQWDQY